MTKVKVAQALLVLGWLALQVLLFQQHGVRIAFDSHRFILFTQEILAGEQVTYIQVYRYLGYPLLLIPLAFVGLSLKYVVFAQMLLSGVAGLTLYKTVKELTRNVWIALGATALFVLNPDLQAWNGYILTDSLFISLLTISLCLALLPKTRATLTCLMLAVAWTTLVRPNGFIILLAIAAFLVVKHKPFRRFNRWVIGIASLAVLTIFYLVLDIFLLEAFRLMIPYERGDLIYGYYGIVLNKYYQPQMPPSSLTQLGQVIWFIGINPFYFTAMALMKGFFFFIHAKPFYSLGHNAAILAYLIPVYFLAWVGWVKGQLSAPEKVLLLTPVILQAGITMLTIEDWDGRWLYPVLPCFLLLAALGLKSKVTHAPKPAALAH